MKLVYRVPPGWTREAARLVRADWETAKEGGIPTIEGGAEDEFYVAAFKRDREVIPGLEIVDAPCDDGTPRCYARWTSPEARLRAWAAVSAPVLAPAEDGRPSLAEWVAACESLGMHSTMDAIGDDACICYWSTSQGGPCEYPVVRIRDAASVTVDTVTSDGHSVDTPAELRALLDTLAIEAR